MQPSTLQNFSTAKDFHEEEERMKLRILQADAGLIGNKDLMVTAERMDWMYHNPVQSKQAQEDYLLGKPIQPVDEKQEMRRRLGAGAAASSSLFINAVTSNNEDTMRRLREDPLFLIQQAKYRQTRLECAREKILTTIQKPYGDKNETKLYSAHDLVFKPIKSEKQKPIVHAESSPCLSASFNRKISRSNKISGRLENSHDRIITQKKNTITHYSNTSSSRHQVDNDTFLSVNKKLLDPKHLKNSSIHARTKVVDFSSHQCLSGSNSSTERYNNVSKPFMDERISSTFFRKKSHCYENKKYRNRHKKPNISPVFSRKRSSHKQREESHSVCRSNSSLSHSLKRKKVSNSCKRLVNQSCSFVSNDNQLSLDSRENQRSPISHVYNYRLTNASISPGCIRSLRYEKSCRSNSLSEVHRSKYKLHKNKNINGHKSDLELFFRRKKSTSNSLVKRRYRHQRSVSWSRNSTKRSSNFSKTNLNASRIKYSRLSSSKANKRSLEYDTHQRLASRDSHNRFRRSRNRIKEGVNLARNSNSSTKLVFRDEFTRESELFINRQRCTSKARIHKNQFHDDVEPVNEDRFLKHILRSLSTSCENKQRSHFHKSQDLTKTFPNAYQKTTKTLSSNGIDCFGLTKNGSSSSNSDYRRRKQDSPHELGKKHRYKQCKDRTEDTGDDILLKKRNLRINSEVSKSSKGVHTMKTEKTEINRHIESKKIVQGPVCPSEWKGRLDAYSIDKKQTVEKFARDSNHDESLETSSGSSSDLGPPQNFIETITSLRRTKSTVPHLVSCRSKQYLDKNEDSLFYKQNKNQIPGHHAAQKDVISDSELELKKMMEDGLVHEQDKEDKLKIIESIDSIRDAFVAKEREKIWISEMAPVFEKKLLVESAINESKTLNERLKRYVARRQKTLLDRSELEDEQK